MISESRDLSSMDLATLFGKLREHDMELKRLIDDNEGENKKKTLAIKTKENYYDSSNEEMKLIIHNFKRFIKNKKKTIGETKE